MNELAREGERIPKLEGVGRKTLTLAALKLQDTYKDVLGNPANIRIKENLETAESSKNDTEANVAFRTAALGLMQRGVLTRNRLDELITEGKELDKPNKE